MDNTPLSELRTGSEQGAQPKKPSALGQALNAVKPWHWQVLLAIEVIVITALALEPGARTQPNFWGADKTNHILAFIALMVVSRWAFPRLPIWILFLTWLAYGFGIELAQRLTGRTFSYMDVVADGIGLIAGLIILYSLAFGRSKLT